MQVTTADERGGKWMVSQMPPAYMAERAFWGTSGAIVGIEEPWMLWSLPKVLILWLISMPVSLPTVVLRSLHCSPNLMESSDYWALGKDWGIDGKIQFFFFHAVLKGFCFFCVQFLALLHDFEYFLHILCVLIFQVRRPALSCQNVLSVDWEWGQSEGGILILVLLGQGVETASDLFFTRLGLSGHLNDD